MRYLDIIKLMEIADRVKEQVRNRFKQEQPTLTDAQINYYLDRWDRFAPTFDTQNRDITKLTFAQVEQLIDDAETRVQLKGRAKPEQTWNTQDDVLYDKNGLTILKGELREKCIRYGEGYTWCISRKDTSNMFYSYRMRKNEPAFYFVFDKNRPETDVWHAVVIYVDKYNTYYVATADNPGDREMVWPEILQYQPRLNGLESLFKPQPLSAEEKADYAKYGHEVDEETYEKFNLKEKYKYIQFGHELSREQQSATPNELIGTYAKLMPTAISRQTLARLNPSDRRHVEETRVQIVKDYPYLIADMIEPSEAVQMAAVQAEPSVISTIANPTESVQWYALKWDWWLFQDIRNAAPSVEKAAVEKNPFNLIFVKNQEVISQQLLPATIKVLEEEGVDNIKHMLKSWFEHLDQSFVPSALYTPKYYNRLAKKYGDSVVMPILHNIVLHRGKEYDALLEYWMTKYKDFEEQIAYARKKL